MNEPDRCVYNAAAGNHIEQLRESIALHPHLIDAPIPDQGNFRPLQIAVVNGHVSAIETLIELGSRLIGTRFACGGLTPMHHAASHGHTEVIETLVRLGSQDLDALTEEDSNTPMHIAADRGQNRAIETLARLGSQALNTLNKFEGGMSPLHVAAEMGHADTIETLYALGSSLFDLPRAATEAFGSTPMDYATTSAQRAAVEALVRLGSQEKLSTILYLSIQGEKRDELSRVLLALGADPSAADSKWLSVRQRALLYAPLDDDEVLEVRHRVFFARSLVHRLLLELARHANTRTAMQTRGSQSE